MSDYVVTTDGEVGGPSDASIAASAQNAHWNTSLDKIFVDIMLEHETSWAGSTFTLPGWHSIVRRFNEVAGRGYTKIQLQYRWKNLKKDYSSYLYLRNKSGWGWDSVYNKPIPPSDSAWFEVPDKYRKYRNKPFLYFGEIQRFLVKDIATGAHATSSRPGRQKHGGSTTRTGGRRRELDFDENLDECMPEPGEDADESDGVTITPISRKRDSRGKRAAGKKARSGGTLTTSGQELLQNFLSELPKSFAEAREDPDKLANAACREISKLRPDLNSIQFERIADKLATTSGRNVYYHIKDDPTELQAWIERIINP